MGLFDRFRKQAEDVIEERGGMDALKDDAVELKDIVTGEGSLTDKAKEAVEAIKDPGAPGDDSAPAEPATPSQS